MLRAGRSVLIPASPFLLGELDHRQPDERADGAGENLVQRAVVLRRDRERLSEQQHRCRGGDLARQLGELTFPELVGAVGDGVRVFVLQGGLLTEIVSPGSSASLRRTSSTPTPSSARNHSKAVSL